MVRSRSSSLNIIVVLSLIASLFSFSFSEVSAQEATETDLPTGAPAETATDTEVPPPTATAASQSPTAPPAATQTASATQPQTRAPQRELAALVIPAGLDRIADAYIVVFKPGASVASMLNTDRAKLEKLGAKITFVYAAALQGYAALLPGAALDEARANPLVDYLIADGIVSLGEDEVGSEAKQFSPTWGLDRIDQRNLPLTDKYKYNTTAPDVHVYVIDTGIYTQNKEFGGRANKVFDTVGDGQNGNDCHGHGTHLAGTIGGTKNGVAKQVRLHAVRVMNCSGITTYGQVIAGVDWVTLNHQGPAVANVGFALSAHLALDTAIENSINSGVVYVVAAGDSDADACSYSPAHVTNAITVGATDNTDLRYVASNTGTCLDIFAPGVDITSAWIGATNATAIQSGTSMASAHVAGVAALYLAMRPAATPAKVASAIINGSTTGKVDEAGTGSPNRLLFSRFGPLAFILDSLMAGMPPSSRKPGRAPAPSVLF